jgi:hypothetical protein
MRTRIDSCVYLLRTDRGGSSLAGAQAFLLLQCKAKYGDERLFLTEKPRCHRSSTLHLQDKCPATTIFKNN